MGDKVLIIGVSGFTGGYLVEELLNSGFDVFGTYCNTVPDKISDLCKCYKLDLTDMDSCKKLIQNIRPDIVIHLAAQGNVLVAERNPQDTLNINVLGTVNILNAVKEYDKEIRCIIAGTAAVYNDESEMLDEDKQTGFNNIYAMTKYLLEKIVEVYVNQHNMNIVCVRPFNYTGVGQSENTFLPSMCKQVTDIMYNGKEKVINLGNIDIYRDIMDVRDVVRAYRMLIQKKNLESGIYNICSGKATKLRDIIEYLCSKSGENITINQDTSRVRKNDKLYICGDNSKLINALGWKPQYTIYDTIDWMLEHLS